MSTVGVVIPWGYAEGHPWVVVATALAVAALSVAFVAQRARRRSRRPGQRRM